MRGKRIATAVIIILLVAILGVVVYGSMTIDSGKDVGSGEPIISGDIPSGGISSGDPITDDDVSSGNISSGDDVPSTEDPQPEEPMEKYPSAKIPFNPLCIGSGCFQLYIVSDEIVEKLEAGEEFSFILTVDTDKELTYNIYDNEGNYDNGIVNVEQIENANRYKITLCSREGQLEFYFGNDRMDVLIYAFGENFGVIV